MAEEQTDPVVEIKRLKAKLKDIEATMTDITLRLDRMKHPKMEAEARDIRDRVKGLLGRLNTTTTGTTG